jgi:hypothetical protein
MITNEKERKKKSKMTTYINEVMTQKEKYINETLEMGDQIQALELNDGFKNRLKSIPTLTQSPSINITPRMAMAAAAGIILLISLNLISLVSYSESNSETSHSKENSYFSYLNHI